MYSLHAARVAPGSEHYLAEKLAARDPDFFLAEAFVAADDRLAFRCLFGVRAEIRDLLHSSSDPELGLARLGWWREEWGRLADGRPRHPLTVALGARSSFGPEDLDGALAGVAELLQKEGCDTFSEMTMPTARMAMTMARVDAALFGVQTEHGEHQWQAILVSDLILDLPGLLRSGRALLPMDLAAELQVSRQDLIASAENRARLIGRLAGEGASAAAGLGPGVSHAWIYHAIQRRRLCEYRRRGREPGRFARLWAAWRGARRLKRAPP